MSCVEVSRRSFELAEPVLEQVVGAVEVGAQAPGCRGPVLARERLLAGGEEEVLLGRKVVVDRLLGDVGRGRDLGDGDAVEAPLREELHGLIGDLLPCAELLRIAQAHAPIVTQSLQLQKTYSVGKVVALSEGKEI